MKLYRLFAVWITGFIIILQSCNNPGEKISDANPADSASAAAIPSVDTSLSGCYSSIYNRDTATLQIEKKGILVAGPLSYSLFEKDRNDGNFQGGISGEILSGWYLFRSEGIMSVRQIAWKVKGSQLFPGSGEMIQKGDTMFFKNPDMVKYDSLHPFVKVACML